VIGSRPALGLILLGGIISKKNITSTEKDRKLEPSEEVLTALLGTPKYHPVNIMGYFYEAGHENRKV